MNRARWMFGAALAVALSATGCSGTPVAQSSSPAQAAPSPATAPAENRDAPDILSVLTVEHEVDVLAQREGPVVEILKDEGSLVKSGDVLARLDDRTITAELEKAQADLQVSQNNVKYTEAELKAKQANYRRQQQLRAFGLSSEADLEQAEFQAKGGEFDLASWKANVVRAQAEIRRLQVELDQTRIRAPFSGVVARRYLRVGQDAVKSEKCFRISQLSPLQVQFQFPETSAHRPHLGDVVNVTVMSGSARTYPARIVKLGPMVDPSSGSYDVTAQLSGPNLSLLRPGMAVRVAWSAPSSATPAARH